MSDLANVQAAILAGGLGTRLRPLTEKVPKVLVPVLGKPFIHHQLTYLRRAGLRKILLLLAYLGEQVADYCGDGGAWGVSIEYAFEPRPMGTGGALKGAEGRLEDPFLLINGDTFLPLRYDLLLSSFLDVPCQGMMSVFSQDPAMTEEAPPHNVCLGSDGFVKAYDKRNAEGKNGVDAGVSIYRREILGDAPGDRAFSLEEDIFPRLIGAGQLRGFGTHQRFFDMGTPEGLKRTEGFLRRETADDHH